MNSRLPYPRWQIPIAGASTVGVMILAAQTIGARTILIALAVTIALLLAPFARAWYLDFLCVVWAAIDWWRFGSIAGDRALTIVVWVALGFTLGGILMSVFFGITDETVWATFRNRRRLRREQTE